MKKVILFSGGLDSFIAAKLNPNALLVHVNVNEAYSDKQIDLVKSFQLREKREIKLFYGMDLSPFVETDAYLPNRNVLFVTLAALVGDYIILGATRGDVHPDKDHFFAQQMSNLLAYTTNKTVRVSVPYKKTTKTSLVKKYLDAGHIAEDLYLTSSCYHPKKHECTTCRSCLRRYVAFATNGLRLNELSIHRRGIAELLAKRTFSASDVERKIAARLLANGY